MLISEFSWPPAAARSAGDCRVGLQTPLWIRTLSTWREQKELIRVDNTETLQLNLLSACKTQQLTTSLSSSQVFVIIVTLYILSIYFNFFKIYLHCTNALYFLLVLLTAKILLYTVQWQQKDSHSDSDLSGLLRYMKDFIGLFVLTVPQVRPHSCYWSESMWYLVIFV